MGVILLIVGFACGVLGVLGLIYSLAYGILGYFSREDELDRGTTIAVVSWISVILVVIGYALIAASALLL